MLNKRYVEKSHLKCFFLFWPPVRSSSPSQRCHHTPHGRWSQSHSSHTPPSLHHHPGTQRRLRKDNMWCFRKKNQNNQMLNKKESPKTTWRPRIEEDVEASAFILPGPTDAEWCHHCGVHCVMPHDAVCHWSDAHSDCVVRGVGDAACPGALTLLGGEDRNVGALAVLRAGAWVNRGSPKVT